MTTNHNAKPRKSSYAELRLCELAVWYGWGDHRKPANALQDAADAVALGHVKKPVRKAKRSPLPNTITRTRKKKTNTPHDKPKPVGLAKITEMLCEPPWSEVLAYNERTTELVFPGSYARFLVVASRVLRSGQGRDCVELRTASEPVALAPTRAPPELDDDWAC